MYHVGISFERRDEYCDRSSNGPGSTRAPWARAAPRRRGRSRRSWRIPPSRRTGAAAAATSPPMATISQPWFAFIYSSLLLFIGLIIRQRRPHRRAHHFTGFSCYFGDCGRIARSTLPISLPSSCISNSAMSTHPSPPISRTPRSSIGGGGFQQGHVQLRYSFNK